MLHLQFSKRSGRYLARESGQNARQHAVHTIIAYGKLRSQKDSDPTVTLGDTLSGCPTNMAALLAMTGLAMAENRRCVTNATYYHPSVNQVVSQQLGAAHSALWSLQEPDGRRDRRVGTSPD